MADSFDFWSHYDHVCEIAREPQKNVKHILIDNVFDVNVPFGESPALQYNVATNKALIITRHEGYAFTPPSPETAASPVPLKGVIPFIALGRDQLANPSFSWVLRPTNGGDDIIAMPPRPQSIFDVDMIIGLPGGGIASLLLTDTMHTTGIYTISLRAHAWLIPSGKLSNFSLLKTHFNVFNEF